jgi:hypothetical protein
MSKSHQLMDCRHPGPSRESVVKTAKVMLALVRDTLPFHRTLIVRFSELREPIDLSRLDEGSGIEGILVEHKAKWHKSCHTKFNVTMSRS